MQYREGNDAKKMGGSPEKIEIKGKVARKQAQRDSSRYPHRERRQLKEP